VLEDVRTWQSRPLDLLYPILYFDCLFVKSRKEGVVKTKVVYVALGGGPCRGKKSSWGSGE
jgi:putative transposase